MSSRQTKEKRQEELAKKLGDSLVNALNAAIEDRVHTSKRTGDYIVTVAVELADGKYERQSNGELDWETPEQYGTMHVSVFIQDRDFKQFVPYLEVSTRTYDKTGKVVNESVAPFIWNPYVYHYGYDTMFLEDGEYYIEVTIKSPKFDAEHFGHGKRYTDDVVVRMSALEISLPGEEPDMDID